MGKFGAGLIYEVVVKYGFYLGLASRVPRNGCIKSEMEFLSPNEDNPLAA